MPAPQHQPAQGGSFLGTAAAAAAGVIGGALLLDGIRSLAGHRGEPAAAGNFGEERPWGNAADSDLARQAGIDDIGRSDDRAGLFDTARADVEDFDDGDFDFGGDTDIG
jgi:hypothetical protein